MASVEGVRGWAATPALVLLAFLTLWSCGKSRHETGLAATGEPPPGEPEPVEPRAPAPKACSGPLVAGPIRERTPASCDSSSARLSLLTGTLGGAGNLDGRGADARLSTPYGITTDDAGNLFFLDQTGTTIRRIDTASADVSTLVLGTSIDWGSALASDRAGHLYIAEQARILELTLATGAVSVFAGATGVYEHADGRGAEARFADITGIAVSEDYLYVAGGTTIRRVQLSTRDVITLAGSVEQSGAVDGVGSAAELTRTGGITLDDGDALYFTDGSSVRQLDLTTLEVTTLAGSVDERAYKDGIGANARFYEPWGITGDCQGNLYVADGSTIRTVALANAEVSTLAGTPDESGYQDGLGPEARFDLAETITSDGENLYVTEYSEAPTIRQIAIATGETTTLAGAAEMLEAELALYSPGALSDERRGEVFLLDSGIHRVELASGRLTRIDVTFPPQITPVETSFWLADVLTNGADELLVLGNSAVYNVNRLSKQFTVLAGSHTEVGSADGVGTDARFARAEDFVSDGVNLYIAEGEAIRRFSWESEVTTIAGAPGRSSFRDGRGNEASFVNAVALEYDGIESLFIADTTTVRRLRLSSNEVTTFAGAGNAPGYEDGIGAQARFVRLSEITRAKNGNLYVLDGARVRKISIETAEVTTVAGSPELGVRLCPANLSRPVGLTALPSGQLLISDADEPSLLLLDLVD